jgi:hypothetical protein
VRKSLRKILLLISLVLFALSVHQVIQHWDYRETLADLDEIIKKTVKKETLVKEIQLSIKNNEFDDARMYLAIAKSINIIKIQSTKNSVNLKTLELEIDQKDTTFHQIITQTRNFSSSFFKGKASNAAGVVGSVVADFTVIGDARDLTREYVKYQRGDSVNKLIVLLSGAGVGLTALTIGTRGVAAPAKAGTSVIKAAVKTQRITRGFQKHLLNLGRQVFDWPLFTRTLKNNKNIPNIRRAVFLAYHPKAIQTLKKIANQVNTIRQSTSVMDTVHLLKYIDTPHDLIQLEKVSLKYGTRTKGMMKLLGKSALRTVRVLQKTTKLLLGLLSSLLSGLFSLFLLFARKII